MSDEQKRNLLGKQLKKLRVTSKESLAEVSGAVEIDIDTLDRFEQGQDCPGEDILMLLISHFQVKEDAAAELWELAGYDQPKDLDLNKSKFVVLPADARINYTDMAHVLSNQYGVVLNFMQTAGPEGQSLIVSRVGMSKEHASDLIKLLQESLKTPEIKALPAPSRKTKKSQKTDK